MISHEYQCIFIHIPKCAGTSIESALGHLDNHSGRGAQDHRSIRMIEKPYITANAFSSLENINEVIRRQYYQYFKKPNNHKNRITVTRKQYESYYKFTIVRNPWSRAFSWYNNVINDDVHLRNYGITTDISFNDFLLKFAGKGALRPQLDWIKCYDGTILLDYIGRFEYLTEDVHEIFKQLNLNNLSLPHALKGTNSNYTKYYDKNSYNIILDKYQEEINYFNYTFET